MAVISSSSFDPLNRYVSVRMQQGVPLVDRDWNEREDARKFEARSALRWFASDGIAFEKDAFRIDGTGAVADFTIRSDAPGAPTGLTVGRGLANGQGALITQDVAFRAQPLHVASLGSAALASRLGVPTIPELPAGPGTLLVYLDVWERYVSPAEDGTLVLPGLGVESCGRFKREWAVRVAAGTSLPAAAGGHDYIELARIAWAGAGAVNASDVTDRRERRLWEPPATLLLDLFGTSGVTDAATIASYRQGANRPPVSYRDALNALLLGHLPGSPDVELAVTAGTELPLRPVADGGGNLIAPLISDRANPGVNFDIYLARASLSNADAGFEAPLQVTSGLTLASAPQIVPVGANDFILPYAVDTLRVAYRRGGYPGIATVAEEPAVANGNYEGVVAGVTGTTAVFVFLDKGASQWVYRRRNLTTGVYLDATPQTFLSTNATDGQAGVPILDAAGNLWFAVAVTGGVQARAIDATGAGASSPVFSGSGAGPNEYPSVAIDTNGDVWVFFGELTTGLWFANFHGGSWTSGFLPGTQHDDGFAQAAVDQGGAGLWLTWQRLLGSGGSSRPATYLRFYNARTRAWGPPRALTTTSRRDTFPSPFIEPNGALWVAWSRTKASFVDTRANLKRVFTRV